jgi:hexosaminidase
LNPATEATFELLTKLFGDLTGGARGKGLFPENLIHLGGDEVNTDCWTQSPNISAWLKSKGLTADGGYAFFVNRTSHIALGMGRDVVAWEEVWDHFGTRLDKSTIIHQWLPGSTIAQNATSHGYRCLWSTDGVWYLDGLFSTWETMYAQEPCTGIDDATCEKLVLGGGGAMWGETVDTSDIQQTVWPRLAAIAERLWSPKSAATTPDNARARFSAFRCLLNRRGIAAAPANNKIARGAPPGPGGCLAQ